MMANDDEVRALRAMVEDSSIPVEYRQQAAARLAELCPSPEDGIAQFLSVIGPEAVAAIASFWKPDEDEDE